METRVRLRAGVELAAAVAVPAAAVVLLHGLGDHPRLQVPWSDLDLWLRVTAVDDVVAALLRLVGLAAAYWVLVTTAVYVLARAARVPSAVRAVEWATLPVVRRAADRAVAVVLVGSSLGGHAGTALAASPGELPGVPPPPVVQQVEDPWGDAWDPGAGKSRPDPGSPADDDPAEAEAAGPLPDVPPAPPSPAEHGDDSKAPASAGPVGGATPTEARPASVERADRVPAEKAQAARYEVVEGDNLWLIADAVLTEAWDRAPAIADTHEYWRALIEGNAERLRSGDPDLIYPGEVLVLPAIPKEQNDG